MEEEQKEFVNKNVTIDWRAHDKIVFNKSLNQYHFPYLSPVHVPVSQHEPLSCLFVLLLGVSSLAAFLLPQVEEEGMKSVRLRVL